LPGVSRSETPQDQTAQRFGPHAHCPQPGRIGSTWGHHWRYCDAAFVKIQSSAALIRAAHCFG
jgi:hypothetical protein